MTLKNIPVGYRIAIATFVLVLIDQVVKILVHTHLEPPSPTGIDSIKVFPWFNLCYVENPGFAFGMQLGGDGAVWGKIFLSLFRIVMIGALIYAIRYLLRKGAEVPKGVIVGAVLILAGAIGNLVDSMFYGLLLDSQDGGFLMGQVIDMIQLPLFRWESCPIDALVDSNGYFFGPVFNVADAYISCAVVYLLIFQFKFLNNSKL